MQAYRFPLSVTWFLIDSQYCIFRYSTSQVSVGYLASTTISPFASTASNVSVVINPSNPVSAEAFISMSVLTAGNIARFTVVSRDAYGNNVANPAYKSAFLLFPQGGGHPVIPIAQLSNEVQFSMMRKLILNQKRTKVCVTRLQRAEFTSWVHLEYQLLTM